MKKLNARLTLWGNGETVKVTVRPGQALSWNYSRRTDEGFTSGGFQVSLEQKTGIVILQEWSEGRDCDGRTSFDSILSCHVSRLHASVNGFGEPGEGYIRMALTQTQDRILEAIERIKADTARDIRPQATHQTTGRSVTRYCQA